MFVSSPKISGIWGLLRWSSIKLVQSYESLAVLLPLQFALHRFTNYKIILRWEHTCWYFFLFTILLLFDLLISFTGKYNTCKPLKGNPFIFNVLPLKKTFTQFVGIVKAQTKHTVFFIFQHSMLKWVQCGPKWKVISMLS